MKRILVVLAAMLFPVIVMAQGNTPGEYMQFLSAQDDELSKKYMSYMSEVAHGGRARKMEKRREDVVNTIRQTMRDCAKVKPYKGDASLRDAYREYYFVLLSVFNEDYEKIVDMEEVAERSYDAMEAYLLTQEKVDEKLDDANEKLRTVYSGFAAKNNIQLVKGPPSKLNRKLAKVSAVNKYMHQIYLIFFKSNVQETLMLEALEKKDINSLEQYKSSLLKFSAEGLARLDTVRSYNGDGSLTNACRKVLEFHKSEAENKVDIYSRFLMKEDEFEKTKRSVEAKGAARTNADVDIYNAAVGEFGQAVNQYNKINKELYEARNKVMTHWITTQKRFMDHHIPH